MDPSTSPYEFVKFINNINLATLDLQFISMKEATSQIKIMALGLSQFTKLHHMFFKILIMLPHYLI